MTENCTNLKISQPKEQKLYIKYIYEKTVWLDVGAY